MNEEEKFVIKTLKDSQNAYIENTKVKKVELSTDEAKVVLNLIEKQQKELEQIEEEHKEENGRLRDRVKELEETLKRTQKSWFEDTKKIEIYKMLEANIAKANEIIKDGIPKSLVKEKMQELDKEEKEAQESISDEEREEYSDASIGYLLMNIETRRNVLQELLEESD